MESDPRHLSWTYCLLLPLDVKIDRAYVHMNSEEVPILSRACIRHSETEVCFSSSRLLAANPDQAHPWLAGCHCRGITYHTPALHDSILNAFRDMGHSQCSNEAGVG